MSSIIGCRSHYELERVKAQRAKELKLASALDVIYRESLRRMPKAEVFPQRIKTPKEYLTEDDIATELRPALTPFMLTIGEVNKFIQRLKDAGVGVLSNFQDMFGSFSREYLRGVSRLSSDAMWDLFEAFKSRL